ncbi:single-stranded DNA-binding protein [Staphylococcus gallinarum]|uniref:single-stranded DNA-binding protein n=1 Tax=Staphylococcus gallinarum TaxID=1293 RepID=UPI0030BC75AB
MNNGQIIGNLVNDVELKEFQRGDKTIYVVNGVIACNEKYGEREITSYIDFTVYNNKAKVISDYVSKGNQLGLSGKLRTDSYEDNKGIKRKKTYLFVEDIDLLQKSKEQKEV